MDAPSGPRVAPALEVGQRARAAVEDEPPLLPVLEPGGRLVQHAAARGAVDGHKGADVDGVARGLHVLPEVQVLGADGKVAGEGPLLSRGGSSLPASVPAELPQLVLAVQVGHSAVRADGAGL